MSLQLAWRLTLPSLDLSPQQRDFAESLELVQMHGDTMRFHARQPVTQANADKLAQALYAKTGSSVNVIITQQPVGITTRGYRLKDAKHERR
jgi:hypothetical protein